MEKKAENSSEPYLHSTSYKLSTDFVSKRLSAYVRG